MGLDLSDYVRRSTILELGGKKICFSELTLADFAQFRARVMRTHQEQKAERRRRIIEDAKAIGDVDRLELLRELDKPTSEAEIEEAAETVEGAAFLAYLGAKHNHPELTEEQMSHILTLRDVPAVVAVLFGGLNAVPEKKMTPLVGEQQ
jgi:acyl-CoA reductase-like NAD-dependent aldehyde dehydrogenase